MQFYRRKAISVIQIAFIILSAHQALSVAYAAENTIFVVDTSGSMKKDGLFDKVKQRLTAMVRESKIGDGIVIIPFDTSARVIVDMQISSQKDKAHISSLIDGLRAKGAWTRMCHAFDITVQIANRLSGEHPQNTLAIYLFTDGLNDPPPNASSQDFEDFSSCIKTYFSDFHKDSFVYILHYGTLSEEKLREIEDSTNDHVKVRNVSRQDEDPFPFIKLAFLDFSFGELNLSKGSLSRAGTLTIKSLSPGAIGSELSLSIYPTSQFDARLKIAPETITGRAIGQNESISIKIPKGAKGGDYVVAITASRNITVDPPRFPFSFTVIKDPSPHIDLAFLGLPFGELDLSKGAVTKGGTLVIKNLSPGATGTELTLRIPPVSAFGPRLKIRPEKITCRKDGQKESISIIIPKDAEGRDYSVNIKASRNVEVNPFKFPFSFTTRKKGNAGWNSILLIIFFILLIGLIILYLGLFRKKRIYVVREDIAKQEIAVVRGWGRLYLGEAEGRAGQSSIPVGLPDSCLRLGLIKSSIYLINGPERVKLINYVDTFPCKVSEGNDVFVRFRKIEASEPISEQNDGNEKRPVSSKINWPD